MTYHHHGDTATVVVSIAQAARMLSVSPSTIRRMLAAGVLPVWKHGRLIRIPVAAIHALLAQASHITMAKQPDPDEDVEVG